MSPSRQKYKEAVQAAKDFCYGNITDVPEHFDERQRRSLIGNTYVSVVDLTS